ncbi:HEAT repeat domain-containing protein [Paraliobacillus salinarum]|uniref:HEAT repeat domain-containing protein n=1 Tax=Paraliobacillus salinarum TaxID=1158996 RepID=UPI0015F4AF98|nr:HEAT repeat domain-containing protein [Paraliobacillus salinarum]
MRKRINMHKDKYRVPIFEYLSSGETTRLIQPIGKERKVAIEELLKEYVSVLDSLETRLNLSRYAETHLMDLYLNNLKSIYWGKRMNTLFNIENFHMTSLEEEVIEHILNKQSAQKEEKIQGLCILAHFQSNSFESFLEQNYKDLSEFDLRNILRRLNDIQLEDLIVDFDNYEQHLQCAILDRISLLAQVEFVPFLESVFFNKEDEIRIRALKALSNIGHVQDIRQYFSLCQSTIWQERMLLAKLLKIIQDEQAIPCLKKLLHDQSWWVRSQAGQTIASYPSGNVILNDILIESNDNFAKDMARECLDKGVLI